MTFTDGHIYEFGGSELPRSDRRGLRMRLYDLNEYNMRTVACMKGRGDGVPGQTRD